MPRLTVLVAARAQFTAQDRLVEVDLSVAYLDIVAAFGVCTYPRLVPNRRPLASEVRQGDEVALVTLLAFREWSVLQGYPPPRPNISRVVYPNVFVGANISRRLSFVHVSKTDSAKARVAGSFR